MNSLLRPYLVLLFLSVLSINSIFSQCDEYYINELISGVDETCSFPSGSPVRFCAGLNGMAINGTTFDVMQWDGISTQYLTLTKNGGIAGTVVLKLNEKELLVNLYGCGGARTYSISLNKSEFDNWIIEKPNREKIKTEELLRQQEDEINKKIQADKLDSLIRKNNLDDFYITIDKSIVNEAIKQNAKFRKIIELSDKDTLIFEFKNGKLSHRNFNYSYNDYCSKLWYFTRTEEYRRLPSEKQDSIERLHYEMCRREKTVHFGYSYYKIQDFFPTFSFRYDTIIDNTSIPLNNFRIFIVKNNSSSTVVNAIFAPSKYSEKKLFIYDSKFTDKYQYDGYYTTVSAKGFEPIFQSEKTQITYTDDIGKDIAMSITKFNLIYVDDIFIAKENLGEQTVIYKFKKIK
jgi:hypothetical protein